MMKEFQAGQMGQATVKAKKVKPVTKDDGDGLFAEIG